jgi:hypothetical protein
MLMFQFCTYFDQYYLTRGLALYRSLREHCHEFRLWVLCMDGTTYHTLVELQLPGVHPIALEEFERDDESLQLAKTNRSRIEYYFTCTPSLPLYILNNQPEVDLITYLDADLFFFSSPAPLFEEMKEGSVAIIGHRFPPNLKGLERHGIYNVGWLSFRRDANGLACLHWWRDRCIEWCYDRLENGQFGDQKYLDDWPSRFQNVVVLEHKGANVAPWNLANYCLRDQNGNTVMIDSQPLVFFHFHGLKKITQWLYNPSWEIYGVTSSMVLRRRIYVPYIRTLFDVSRQLLPMSDACPISDNIREKQVSRILRVVRWLRILPSVGRNILAGSYILTINGHIV